MNRCATTTAKNPLETLLCALLAAVLMSAGAAQAQPGWDAISEGSIVLFRHANAPGTGDPENFKLNDCSTQRNLDEAGRQQSRRLGAQFRERKVAVGRVLTSQWCRTRETAQLAFPGLPVDAPVFNSFFEDRSTSDAQTAQALQTLTQWRGPGVLVVITHQVNITALTDIYPNSGDGVVLRPVGQKLQVLGRVQP
jgi:phosphohistidine phosphatase SixA